MTCLTCSTQLRIRYLPQSQSPPRWLVRRCCDEVVLYTYSSRIIRLWSERGDSIPAYEFQQYSLFTWNVSSGDFCFALMTTAESHKFIHSWTAKRHSKCGALKLKQALAALPKDTVVLWHNWPPRKMDYPAENIVQEIVQFAESNRIHVRESPALR